MSRKPTLNALVCFILLCITTSAFAQQKNAFKGRLLSQQLRPRGSVADIFSASEGRHARFRTYDGRDNNIRSRQTADWGAADIILFREMSAAYGPSDPQNAMGGVNRPSPRKISNVLIDEPVTVFNTRGLSTLVYQWGQFLDHEFTLTPTDTIEYVPIPLPPGEVVFTEAIPFFRSEFRSNNNSRGGLRQQINLNTSWIDGSVVYGSDPVRALWLRTLRGGKLKISKGNLMPYNTLNGELSGAIDPNAPSMANDGGGTIKTFVAGDVRAAENPVLTSIHTLFVREHNRICNRLIIEGMRNDELIYQTARKEVGALIQAITYQEFLPALGITLHQYPGYRDDVRPDIMNTFATAAYRLGHTMVSDDVVIVDNDCEEVGPGEFELVDVFWTPGLVPTYGVDVFLRGAGTHDQYQTDTKINNVLRNFLFGNPSDPVRFGIDLGSLNIQRGRDHGLPDYNTVRRFYTGRGARRFSDITTVDSQAQKIRNVYNGDINNVDLWIGVLSEDHIPGTSVGRTLHEILRTQFENLRDGDFYFYLNDPFLPNNIRNQIKNTPFSKVILRNSGVANILSNVFLTVECPGEEEADANRPPVDTREAIVAGNVRIYPNPVRDVLNIDLRNNKNSSIEIISITGVIVKQFKTVGENSRVQVNMSSLPSGIYAAKITSDGKTKSIRFVKM